MYVCIRAGPVLLLLCVSVCACVRIARQLLTDFVLWCIVVHAGVYMSLCARTRACVCMCMYVLYIVSSRVISARMHACMYLCMYTCAHRY
jgi:hypothetical protein